MQELTEKGAVLESYKQWRELADTGSGCKIDYSGWNEYIKKYGHLPVNYCPLCEFSKSIAPGQTCKRCPMLGRWGRERLCTYSSNKGLYDKWNRVGTSEARKKCAAVIRDLLKQRLDELEGV